MARQNGRNWAGTTALVLGTGALSIAASHADVPRTAVDRVTGSSAVHSGVGDVVVEVREGRIFLIEPGRAAEELILQGGANPDLLKQLVESAGNSGSVVTSPLVVADGGGGVQWGRPKRTGASTSPTNTEKASAADETKSSAKDDFRDEKKVE